MESIAPFDIEPSTPFDYALLSWSEFGNEPHLLFEDPEYIKILGNYTMRDFINDLNNPCGYDGFIYRLTRKDNNYSVGSVIELQNPTSWSSSKQVVSYMSGELTDVVFFVMSGENANGIYNEQNQYGEDEFILVPMKLKITKMNGNWITVEIIN
jgi:hypothetical protein